MKIVLHTMEGSQYGRNNTVLVVPYIQQKPLLQDYCSTFTRTTYTKSAGKSDAAGQIFGYSYVVPRDDLDHNTL
jgi:hypothetical protein